MNFLNIEVIKSWCEKSIYTPRFDILSSEDLDLIDDLFKKDCSCYFSIIDNHFDFGSIKYFPGLLATLFYRISRKLFLNNKEEFAKDFSAVGFFLSGCELYYSAHIGNYFKINHAVGTIVGARVQIGDNVILHQGITLGDKNGGRPILKDNIIVNANTTIVGDIVIENNCIIGANVFLDKSLNQNSKYGKR